MITETEHSPRVVVIGGGTGSFNLLSHLKHYVADLTALVNMVDDGGSTGQLRDELGVLPTGDIRQCLVAMSNSSELMRELFNYRFSEGTFGGHTFGNLFLSAVQKMTDDFDEAVDLASEVLNIHGTVLPMTTTDCHLVMHLNGKEIVGEEKVIGTQIKPGERANMSLTPRAVINPAARQAIERADMIVIAPGNLYGSLIPALLIDGVAGAIQNSNAKVVYVCNLVNKAHQASDFSVNDYVQELERYIGQGTINYVLYNDAKPSAEALKIYEAEGETPVRINERDFKKATYKAKSGDFVSAPLKKDATDKFVKVKRNLIRHNADAVSRALMRIYFS